MSLFDPRSGAVVAVSILVEVVKETGRHNDRWRSSRRQEFDAGTRSSTIRTLAIVITVIGTDPTAFHARRSARDLGSAAEIEDKAEVDARFTASHTRGVESTSGAEETHAPRRLPTSHNCSRRFLLKNFGGQRLVTKSWLTMPPRVARAISESELKLLFKDFHPEPSHRWQSGDLGGKMMISNMRETETQTQSRETKTTWLGKTYEHMKSSMAQNNRHSW